MREEYDDYLVESYPKLYRDRYKSMKETTMMWGFEVGDGWFDLINEASRQLEFLNDLDLGVVFIADQVKEKYGTLRFYIHSEGTREGEDVSLDVLSNIGWAISDNAEHRSESVCEVCGKYGYLSKQGWYKTRCAEHHSKED